MERAKSLAEIKKIVNELEPGMKEEDTGYKAAILLIAGIEHGHRISSLAKLTSWPIDDIKKIAINFRKNGIWKGGKTYHGGWFDKETGGIAFWTDVLCGEGLLERKDAS